MEAYDAAVLSYALATAAIKIRPGLLGVAPILPAKIPQENSESSTPPQTIKHQKSREQSDEARNDLHQLLSTIETQIINKTPLMLPQLMEICETKQNQVDQQVIAYLEGLHNELRQISKYTSSSQQLQFKLDEEEEEGEIDEGVSLRSQVVCKTLTELFKQFGLVLGANLLKKSSG